MLAQICQFLGVDINIFPYNEHIIIADKSRDGGFLTHFFLNLCLKQNRPVCFVGFAQSFNHYNSVAQKLGTSLLSANNNLVFIEGLQRINDVVGYGNVSENPFFDLMNGKVNPLLMLLRKSLEKITSNKSPVVIFDDLSVLLSAGITREQLAVFVRRVQHMLKSLSPKLPGTLIASVAVGEYDLDDNILACLCHSATLSLEVSNLKSGYCKEVHGQIQIQWQDSQASPRKKLTKITQYKLLDKTINIFASGMSAAVL